MSDYQEIIDHAQLFEIAVEIIPEPVIYEVPINIYQKMEMQEIAIQTDAETTCT